MSHVGHVSNVATELSAREAARCVLETSPSFQNLDQVVKGSSSWQRPKLLTAVLKELVKQPVDRRAATARGAGRLLEVLRTQRLEVNLFHYNSAINVCSKCSAWDLSLAFLQHMPCISIQPDVVSYNAVMGACGEASRWQVVLYFLSNVPLVNLLSFNTAIKAFDRSGHWHLALHTLKLLPLAGFQPDLVTYGSVMNALAAGGRWQEVGRLLQVMFTDRLDPDLPCFTSFIKACGRAKKWRTAVKILDVMLEAKVIPDHIACSSAIATCSSPQWLVALSLFHWTSMPDVAVFNALLMSLSQHWKMAMHLLQRMPKMRVNCDEITRTLASESYSQGTQWASSLCLWNFLPLPARALPSQWRAGLETARCRSLNPELASQVARCLSNEQWHLALYIFNQMDWITVQRDERNWSDALVACQKGDAWRLVLNALPVLPGGASSAYQAAILACENRSVALELCLRYQSWMTPAAVCGIMARLLVNDPNIIHCSMVAAYEALDESWSPQDLSLLWWACAMLGVNSRALCRKLKELSLASLHLMSMQGLLALAVGASAAANEVSGKDGVDVLSSMQDEICLRMTLGVHLSHADILGVISACKSTASVQRQLEEKTKKLLHQVGFRMDQMMSMKGSGMMELKARKSMVAASNYAEDASTPAVILNLKDQAVLYKPAGWEVYDQHVPKQLRTFAIETFPNKAILQDMESNCGFLHRLDVPNSGLLLLATSYGAYYDLQLQLAAGHLIRDYLVFVHGVASQRPLLARLQRQAERSVAGGRGRPSCTKVLKVLKMAKDTRDQRAFTLMHLQIVTGRQHQIRCHLAHVGHPVVCDGLYSSFETFHSDCSWSPRNWLHRCRLAFQGPTRAHEVSMALPRDLAETLPPKLRTAAEEWVKKGSEMSEF